MSVRLFHVRKQQIGQLGKHIGNVGSNFTENDHMSSCSNHVNHARQCPYQNQPHNTL